MTSPSPRFEISNWTLTEGCEVSHMRDSRMRIQPHEEGTMISIADSKTEAALVLRPTQEVRTLRRWAALAGYNLVPATVDDYLSI